MKINKVFVLIVIISFLIAVALGAFTKNLLEAPNRKIVVNQVGYYSNSPKIALLVNSSIFWKNTVELVESKSNQAVFAVNLGGHNPDEASKHSTQTIDFTSFNKEGTYYLKYGKLQSYPFQIGKDAYQDALTKLLRSYYLQRCGVAVSDRASGINHPPCHIKDGLLAHKDSINPAGKSIRAVGGWHDAGDFGKYVSSTAVTIGRLLNVYEQYPKIFTDRQLNIPESGNGKPDILDEVKVGLDWMLTMQRSDGAVYRKLSGKNWPGKIVPHEDTQQRFIYGISTPETAKFAAAMAMAGRLYTSYDAKLAQTYLQAAQKAWAFLQKEQSMKVDWVDGDDSGSGKYLYTEGDYDPEGALRTDKDDRVWAAAELFITTGDDTFEQYLIQTVPLFSYTLFEWADPSSLGMIDYLMQTRRQGIDDLKQLIKEKLTARADSLVQQVSSSGYRLANNVFIWGSNKRAAEEGITLFYAYRVTGNQAYLKAAVEQLDYLLGRNHFNKSFITSVGTKSVRYVHHRIAQAKKIVIPGLMVNGPNTQAQDGIAPKGLGPLSYVDDDRSYATNEYAIDYNASVIGLMGMLMGEANGK
jgi:endoglucanase